MSPAVWVLIKLAIRLVVFALVFFLAAKKNPKIVIHNKWATPLIALVFALLNTGVYWALTPILNLATLGAMGFIMPFVVNIIFLLGTVKVFDIVNAKRKAENKKPWLEIQGIMATLWMAGFLTLAHGALYLGLDYFPNM
ncbi:MAG: phage holin family protein [Deltaproteobacteria bacterium]|nr:phage holin family protein [Deltaproteobacteria bacterium]